MRDIANLHVAVVTHVPALATALLRSLNSQTIAFEWVAPDRLGAGGYDLIIIDCRQPVAALTESLLSGCDVPKIALVAENDTYQTDWACGQNFHGILPDTRLEAAIYSCLMLAQSTWCRVKRLCDKNRELEEKLGCRRFIVLAQLNIMTWFGYSEKEAYALLRDIAMENQMSIEQLCIDILSSPQEWQYLLKRRPLAKAC